MGIFQSIKNAPRAIIDAVKDTLDGIKASWLRNGYQALDHSLRNNVVDAGKAVVHSINPAEAGTAANLLGRTGARMASIGINITSGIVKIAAPIFVVVGLVAAYKAITHYMKDRKTEGVPTGEFNDQIRNPTLQDEYNKGQQMAFEELGARQGINYRADNAARVQQRRGGAAVETGVPIAQREQARAAAASTQQNGI